MWTDAGCEEKLFVWPCLIRGNIQERDWASDIYFNELKLEQREGTDSKTW